MLMRQMMWRGADVAGDMAGYADETDDVAGR